MCSSEENEYTLHRKRLFELERRLERERSLYTVDIKKHPVDENGVLLSEAKQKLLALSEEDAERLLNLMHNMDMIDKRIKEFDKELDRENENMQSNS
jgi:hypothetical protein